MEVLQDPPFRDAVHSTSARPVAGAHLKFSASATVKLPFPAAASSGHLRRRAIRHDARRPASTPLPHPRGDRPSASGPHWKAARSLHATLYQFNLWTRASV